MANEPAIPPPSADIPLEHVSFIRAIDPGTTQSAIVEWNGQLILRATIMPNQEVVKMLDWIETGGALVIEMVASYGMPVGKEVFETVRWIGRFEQAFAPNPTRLIYRRDVKLHHCGSARAKDSNIRQALIDKYGPPGTKKNPGVTYGLKADLWSAFALATFALETATKPSITNTNT
jgi:hypothetical protein